MHQSVGMLFSTWSEVQVSEIKSVEEGGEHKRDCRVESKWGNMIQVQRNKFHNKLYKSSVKRK